MTNISTRVNHRLRREAKLAKQFAKRCLRGNPDYDLIGLRFFHTCSTLPEDTFILRKDAQDLQKRGHGRWVGDQLERCLSIRLFDSNPVQPFGTMGKGFPTDNARRYDKIGLEKYPIEVLGGLCRTEHQPSIHSNAPGWKPLH